MTSTPARDLQREFLAITRKGQETVVHVIKVWAEAVGSVTPKLPSAYQPLADRLRAVNVLRTPEEALADAYRLAERLLDSQRKLAEDLLRATVPLLQPGRTRTAPAATEAPAASEAKSSEATEPKAEH